jgi:hypothetical protein
MFGFFLVIVLIDLAIVDSMEDLERLGLIEWMHSLGYERMCDRSLPKWKENMSEVLMAALSGNGDALSEASLYDEVACFGKNISHARD